MHDTWIQDKHKGINTGVLLFDLSAAFDTIDFCILETKLISLGFSKSSLLWIRSYMTKRNQKVKIGSCTSKASELKTGVPQGSVLGPLIFILYVYDLQSWIGSNVKLFTYADDIVVSYSSKDVPGDSQHFGNREYKYS